MDARRAERRIRKAIEVEIIRLQDLSAVETAMTEDISARGARILTRRDWRIDEVVAVASLAGDFRATARVVYCEPGNTGCSAIGVEILNHSGAWPLNLSASA